MVFIVLIAQSVGIWVVTNELGDPNPYPKGQGLLSGSLGSIMMALVSHAVSLVAVG